MRYQVHLINNPTPFTVEATEFHPQGSTSIIFYKERMRPNGMNDTWGNPHLSNQRIAVAFMTNVESVVEIPEEDQFTPQVDLEAGGLNNEIVAGPNGIRWMDEEVTRWAVNQPMLVRRNAVPPPEVPPIGIDGDNVPWDAQQHE